MSGTMLYLFIVDHDQKIFNIVYVADDTRINEDVVKLQQEGRNINCFSAEAEGRTVDEMARDYRIQTGYRYELLPIL